MLTLQLRFVLGPVPTLSKVPRVPLRCPHRLQPIPIPSWRSQDPSSRANRDYSPCCPSPPRHGLESGVRQPRIRFSNCWRPQGRERRYPRVPQELLRSTDRCDCSMEVGDWRCGPLGQQDGQPLSYVRCLPFHTTWTPSHTARREAAQC